MTQFYENSVFWIEVDKIKPNPFQPRREFDQEQLQGLADSIRQYGVLQALVVTRNEVPKEDGGLSVEYELVSGERRLRASKLAGVSQVPALIKTGEDSDLMKLELAIIENVQREDLNPVERARAFEKLSKEFSLTHSQIAKKVGKSREYVSNTLRILSMPDEILTALSTGKLSDGHSRPLMMLNDRPEEQTTLFKEIIYKKLSVREAERVAKRIAHDKVRKNAKPVDPEIRQLEQQFTESLGTRVHIETKEVGGKLSIDFFSPDDLKDLLVLFKEHRNGSNESMLERFIQSQEGKGEDPQASQTVDENQQPEAPAESEPSSSEGDIAHTTEHAPREEGHSAENETPRPEQHNEIKEEQTPESTPSPAGNEHAPSDTSRPEFSTLNETQAGVENETQSEEGDRASAYHSEPHTKDTENREEPAEQTDRVEEKEQSEPVPQNERSSQEDSDLYSVRNFNI